MKTESCKKALSIGSTKKEGNWMKPGVWNKQFISCSSVYMGNISPFFFFLFSKQERSRLITRYCLNLFLILKLQTFCHFLSKKYCSSQNSKYRSSETVVQFLEDILTFQIPYASISKAFIIIFFRVYCCCFAFYPIRRNYIWSIMIQIYLSGIVI